jgi:hypothetical protein
MNDSEYPPIEDTLRLMCAIEALSEDERDHYLAAVRELRRQAWHWREARAIVQQAAERKAILFGALDEWGQNLIGLILGEDAEWEQKAGAK